MGFELEHGAPFALAHEEGPAKEEEDEPDPDADEEHLRQLFILFWP